MKKKNLKNLKLNKKSISLLDNVIYGGAASGQIVCNNYTKANGGCWEPPIMRTFNCPKTLTHCGQPPCVKPVN